MTNKSRFSMTDIHTMIDQELEGKLPLHSDDQLLDYLSKLEAASDTLKTKNMATVVISTSITLISLLTNLLFENDKIQYFVTAFLILGYIVFITRILTTHFDNIYKTGLYSKRIQNELTKRQEEKKKRSKALHDRYNL